MTSAPMRRRSFVAGAAAAVSLPFFSSLGVAADREVFALGIASGQPRRDGCVLWTRLVGAALPAKATVQWEVAEDERFAKVVASGEETAEAEWAHSVRAEPAGLAADRSYFYRFTALGAQSEIGRTRTAPDPSAAVSAPLRLALASCQRFDDGYYAAWRDLVEQGHDLVVFVGDYIYEYADRPRSVRSAGKSIRTLDEYRARYAMHKSDPQLRAAHAAMPWLLVWDDHEVQNDYAGLQGQSLEADFADRRTAAYRAYWEHMPFPKAARPVGPDMRIYGRLDWGRLARFHLVDDRQYRDPQACPRPGRGGSNTVPLKQCPELLDPKRGLLGAAQEAWLAEGWDRERPWNLLVQQTLMARYVRRDAADGDAIYWTDGWDGYPFARKRLLDAAVAQKASGLVVLGGDVHGHYVSDLKADFDDEKSPIVASEFCGTSITSNGPSMQPVEAARPFNPHVHWARTDQRGYVSLVLRPGAVEASLKAVERPADAASPVATAARFAVDPARPGVHAG